LFKEQLKRAGDDLAASGNWRVIQPNDLSELYIISSRSGGGKAAVIVLAVLLVLAIVTSIVVMVTLRRRNKASFNQVNDESIAIELVDH